MLITAWIFKPILHIMPPTGMIDSYIQLGRNGLPGRKRAIRS
jgi:hypothetical protein